MDRIPDWWPRLRRVVEEWDGRPWAWGQSDCACFAAACVEAVTGRDPMDRWRGLYETRLGAAARLRGRGYCDLQTAADGALKAIGACPIDPRAAAVGDVGVTADDVLCVRLPAGWLARRADGRLALVDATRAWAVGNG